MTVEQFLKYIDAAPGYGVSEKQRLAIARAKYAAYVKAYRVQKFLEAFRLGSVRTDYRATRRGAGDGGSSGVAVREVEGCLDLRFLILAENPLLPP